MTNGEIVLVKSQEISKLLDDFFEFLVENKCCVPKVYLLVSDSINNMDLLRSYVKSLENKF